MVGVTAWRNHMYSEVMWAGVYDTPVGAQFYVIGELLQRYIAATTTNPPNETLTQAIFKIHKSSARLHLCTTYSTSSGAGGLWIEDVDDLLA